MIIAVTSDDGAKSVLSVRTFTTHDEVEPGAVYMNTSAEGVTNLVARRFQVQAVDRPVILLGDYVNGVGMLRIPRDPVWWVNYVKDIHKEGHHVLFEGGPLVPDHVVDIHQVTSGAVRVLDLCGRSEVQAIKTSGMIPITSALEDPHGDLLVALFQQKQREVS